MHWYIDGGDKTLPLLEEINEALRQRPAVYVQRGTNGIVFASAGTERILTSEDMKQADNQSRKEFSAALRKIAKCQVTPNPSINTGRCAMKPRQSGEFKR